MPLPKYEDWQAPWEKDEKEFDAETARKLVYNLHREIEVEKAAFADAKQELATVTGDRDELKAKADAAAREGESETDALKRKVAELEARKPEADPAVARRALVLEVALDKGLTAFQAKRLAGETKEELEADADELLVAFGGNGQEQEGEDPPTGVARRPVPIHNRRTPSDGDDPTGLPPYSPENLDKVVPIGM